MTRVRIEHLLPQVCPRGELWKCDARRLRGEDGSTVTVNREGIEYSGVINIPGLKRPLVTYWIDRDDLLYHADGTMQLPREWTDHLDGWWHSERCHARRNERGFWPGCYPECHALTHPVSPSHVRLLDIVKARGDALGWLT